MTMTTMTLDSALWELDDCRRCALHNAAHYDRIGDTAAAARWTAEAGRVQQAIEQLHRNESLDPSAARAAMLEYCQQWQSGIMPLGTDATVVLATRLRETAGYKGYLIWESPKTPMPWATP